ncbi:MAG: type II toxin-antitoxin system HicA family toxin [Armatimonadota bacterium]|nr:type II toxin-antitoxin system HicA family toxin [Armatimonadota bacterium]MDR7392471.1 type II toxin-antitoxin system HicA family toxin [Armatimonadota bacterium]
MRLPRDIGGDEIARLLGRYGYRVVRQTGSHMRLVSAVRGSEHRITIPRHRHLRVGTLAAILKEVAEYLETDRETLVQELFGGS